MVNALLTPRTFLADETGAVTVDWVVLTGALVGLGLATITVVSGGINSTTNDIDGKLRTIEVAKTFGRFATLVSQGFSNGMTGWTGGAIETLPGFGEVLQLVAGETATLEVPVPDGAQAVTIGFDIIGGDDLDGEPATIYVNGQAVAVYADDHGRISTGSADISGISVSMAQEYSNDAVGAGSHGSDSRARYEITVADPGANLSFAVSSGADQSTGNEFYALDDVKITSR